MSEEKPQESNTVVSSAEQPVNESPETITPATDAERGLAAAGKGADVEQPTKVEQDESTTINAVEAAEAKSDKEIASVKETAQSEAVKHAIENAVRSATLDVHAIVDSLKIESDKIGKKVQEEEKTKITEAEKDAQKTKLETEEERTAAENAEELASKEKEARQEEERQEEERREKARKEAAAEEARQEEERREKARREAEEETNAQKEAKEKAERLAAEEANASTSAPTKTPQPQTATNAQNKDLPPNPAPEDHRSKSSRCSIM